MTTPEFNTEEVNLGQYANDGTGDDLRSAFDKVNMNFAAVTQTAIVNGTNLGTGFQVFNNKTANRLTFRTLEAGSNVTLSYTTNGVLISSPNLLKNVVEDITPQLGGNLDLNGFYISDTNYVRLNNLKIVQAEDEVVITHVTPGDNIKLEAGTDLTLSAPGIISLQGEVFADDTVHASIVGSLTGSVTGTVFGTVSSIANHNLADLGNVAGSSPVQGQALVWNGSEWAPGGIVSGVSIDWEFTGFDNTVSNPIQYLLSQQDIDMGTFASPAATTIDLGTF